MRSSNHSRSTSSTNKIDLDFDIHESNRKRKGLKGLFTEKKDHRDHRRSGQRSPRRTSFSGGMLESSSSYSIDVRVFTLPFVFVFVRSSLAL